MALILALTGEKLSGKDTTALYLQSRYGAFHVRHSDFLDEILRILDLSVSRRNEIDLGMALRKTFGNGVLGKALMKRVEASQSPVLAINGVRISDEYQNIRDMGGHLIYVTAPVKMRYERYMNRKLKADDAQQTLQQFQAQEQEWTEREISEIGKKAEYKITNDGTLEALHQKIDQIMSKLIPRTR
nr:Unknown Function [uncultured bacterium]AIA17983.1 Unknown Function [uncultured bacterium]